MHIPARTKLLPKSPISATLELARHYRGSRPILDFCQGVPNYSPPKQVVDHICSSAQLADANQYTPRAGIEELRSLIAEELSRTYGGVVTSDHILVTAGCNQAFCCAVSTIAQQGDEVILPVPYYFNHDMWLRFDGIKPVYLRLDADFVPDLERVEALISQRTRAIVLVTPNNPTGVVLSPNLLEKFAVLTRKHNIMLVLDETYRVFRDTDDAPHQLFAISGWAEAVVSLHSFSKEFAIPGYRVGAAVAHPDLVIEMMKPFECLAVCASHLGQQAAIAALKNADKWRHDRVLEMRARKSLLVSLFQERPGGFELRACGSFYGWVEHPLHNTTAWEVVSRLAVQHGILVLPGTLFGPGNDQFLRFSFANASTKEIWDLAARLQEFSSETRINAEAPHRD